MIRPFPALSIFSAKIPHWPLFLGVLAGGVLCMTPDSNPDLPLHLAAGRAIVAHRAIPFAEPFSWTRQGRPWIDYEWGSQLIFHALDLAGGETALWLFKVAAFAALMIPFIGLGRLWRLPESWIGAALFPFMLSFVPYLNVRPEIFSFLFTGVQLWLLERLRVSPLGREGVKKVLLAQILLYVLWSNLHPGYPMGIALCGCYGVGQALERRKDRVFWMLLAAAVLGSLINPFGIRLYSTFL